MTGTEYLYLNEGDQCVLLEDIETNYLKWNKGDIVEVIYRNRFEETLYFKNTNVKYNGRPSYKALGVMWCLKAMKLYKKFAEKPFTKTTFEHKFNAGNTVWEMACNHPTPHKITELRYLEHIDIKEATYICDDGEILDDNCKIYGSKEELLDSLR